MKRLLLTSGRGPAECRIALARVLAVMAREAEAAGLAFDAAEGRNPDGFGPASAIATVGGGDAERFARSWTGSVLWTAQSPVRPHHKRRNWFIGVMELPAPAAPAPALDPADVRFEAFRAGGPGGQHQNATDSAVRAVHSPSGLSVVVRDQRSQHRNKAIAIERLAELLRLGAELAVMEDRRLTQASHDRLERGRPVRRFKGEDFRPA
jgi:peptide chain release factor